MALILYLVKYKILITAFLYQVEYKKRFKNYPYNQ